jgi:protein O-GlcNAc transferase
MMPDSAGPQGKTMVSRRTHTLRPRKGIPTKPSQNSGSAHSPRKSLLDRSIRDHQEGRRAAAKAGYREILRANPRDFEANLFLGTLCLENREADLAVVHLQQAVDARPDHPQARHYSAMAFDLAGQREEALRAYEVACRLSPESASLRVQFARCSLSGRKLEQAERLFREALDLDPRNADAWHGRADRARIAGDIDHAIENYRQALAYGPSNSYATYMNLALLLQAQGEWEQALSLFEKARDLAPDVIEPNAGLAVCLASMGQYAQAVEIVSSLYTRHPKNPLVHEALAHVYDAQGFLTQSTEAWVAAATLKPESIHYRLTAGQRLLDAGDRAAAVEHFLAAYRVSPDHGPAAAMAALLAEQEDHLQEARSIYSRLANAGELLWNLRQACVIPTILPAESFMDECRQSIRHALEKTRDLPTPRSIDDLVTIGLMPPFNLSFHHRDDRSLREAFSNSMRELMRIERSAGPTTTRRSRPRIGFFCGANPRAFIRSLGGVIAGFDPSLMEPLILCVPSLTSRLKDQARNIGATLVSLPDQPSKMIDAIRGLDLDLLIYFEIGTTAAGYLLAHHRLAPIQIATWGIQVTSGIDNIDYYLSSDLLEAPGAEAHYSERLIRARTLLTVMPSFPVWRNSVSKERLGLPHRGTIYLCPQQLGKFTPRFDHVLAEILRQDPTGHLVITQGNIPALSTRLLERWQRSIPDVVERVRFVPQAIGDNYLHLLAAADVVLDPIDFAGVNTTYDAFSQNKVLVTLPSSFQRTRYAAGCYRLMDISEPVATSMDDYVAKAVRFGRYPDARAEFEKLLRDRTPGLFFRWEAASEMQQILLGLARGEQTW